jgi:hypothetical protein
MTQRDILYLASPYVEFRPVSDEELLRATIMNKCVVSPSGCWEWKGAKSYGYGMMMRDRQRLRVHRLSYELWCGPIPAGMVMRHKCDNPSCVNPSHLEPGTQAENIRDIVARNRHGRRKLTPEQVSEIRASSFGNRELADKYGVGIIAVRRARSGETWTHVPSNSKTKGV